jgi:hypothetical protein
VQPGDNEQNAGPTPTQEPIWNGEITPENLEAFAAEAESTNGGLDYDWTADEGWFKENGEPSFPAIEINPDWLMISGLVDMNTGKKHTFAEIVELEKSGETEGMNLLPQYIDPEMAQQLADLGIYRYRINEGEVDENGNPTWHYAMDLGQGHAGNIYGDAGDWIFSNITSQAGELGAEQIDELPEWLFWGDYTWNPLPETPFDDPETYPFGPPAEEPTNDDGSLKYPQYHWYYEMGFNETPYTPLWGVNRS